MDYEVHSDSAAHMLAAANGLGLTYTITAANGTTSTGIQADGFTSTGVRFSVQFYGKKYLPTGATTTDAMGNTVPVIAAQPGVYAILRWMSSTPFPPTGVTVPSNTTIIPLPADSPVVFA